MKVDAQLTYEVLDSLEQLYEDFSRLLLRQFLLHDNTVEQLSFRGELQHNIDTIFFIKCVPQAEHIWVADGLQYTNLLLEPICLRFTAISLSPLESFHCILHSSGPLDTEVYGCKMAFAKLLEDTILLSKCTAISASGIVEQEPCLVKDGYLIGTFELTALVPANDGSIDERTIAGKIFHHCDCFSILVLAENQAMSV